MVLRQTFFILIFIAAVIFSSSCRGRNNEFVTIALSEKFTSLDTLTSPGSEAAADRVRSLIFNSLVRKNENFEYIGELAKEIKTSDDGKTITFVLQDNVKFHDGKDLTAPDVKYTFDELFKSGSYKSGAFFETIDNQRTPHITAIETPDPKTVSFILSRASLRNQLLSNLVTIPIIPEGTVARQSEQPVGTGPFMFTSFDQSQNVVDLQSNPAYWEGAPKVEKIRLKTVTDANSLQAELQSGGVDIAPLPTNLSPDTLNSLGKNQNLKVEQFNGSNIQYLQFNTQSPPLNNVKLRQAVAHSIDREKIIMELLSGQATIAYSMLPTESWAYNAGTKYTFDPAKAKQLLQESGYKGEPIKYKFSAGNAAVSQYAQVIQNSLKDVGINAEIETMESRVLLQQLALGQFQMNTGIWVGGNQDPIFLKDLFSTGAIPGERVKCCNRSRYSNPEVDKLVEEAVNTADREQAKQIYFRVQEIVSNDVPMLPLWYPANMVVANKRIGNIKIGASGDWGFLKDVTLDGK
ncbi:MAG: ABC transporter substrate-binding protein [Acidobacteriota bacterium]|nr:ABC transporter substrate-binding protein [Acidobacteriota bacterium]